MVVELGRDGLWIETDAEPDCNECKGHGLVDVGTWGCQLERCECVKKKQNPEDYDVRKMGFL